MVAAKMGLPDPDANPRLRTAILAARAQNMPKDNIERAIKKSSDDGDTVYEEVRYEGFGPAGIGIIVETLTDNRNRTAAEVRSTFAKNGGNLGETGSVSFMFDRVGQLSSTLSALMRKPCLKRPLRPVRKMWTVLMPAMKLSALSRNCIILSMLCKIVWVSRAQPVLSGGAK